MYFLRALAKAEYDYDVAPYKEIKHIEFNINILSWIWVSYIDALTMSPRIGSCIMNKIR